MAVIIKTFATPGGKYVFDRETNSLLSVSEEEYDACQRVEVGASTESDEQILQRYTSQGYLKNSRLQRIEHFDTKYIQHHLSSGMMQITMQVTQNCNLRCSYCTYSGGYNYQRSHANKIMTLEMMKKSIDFLMARSRNVERVAIGFYGGEPLLAVGEIKKCVEYVNETYRGRLLSYTITTNGTMFDDDTISFLIENDFNVSISLDGPKELHDKNRIFSNGQGSFDKIIKNISYIKEKHPLLFKKMAILTTVAPGVDLSCITNFYAADAVLEDRIVTASTVNAYGAKGDVSYDDLYFLTNKYEMMKMIFSKIGDYDKNKISKLFSRNFISTERTYGNLGAMSITEVSHPGGPCVAGAMRPFVDVNGNIYPCERVNEESEIMRIGHVDTGFDFKKIDAILNVGQLTENECKACWSFMHCTLCVAACDANTTLSRETRLQHCNGVKESTLETLRTICLLLENGYDFTAQESV